MVLGAVVDELRVGFAECVRGTCLDSLVLADCGAFGVRVTDRAELDRALADAVGYDGPAMIEVMTDADLV